MLVAVTVMLILATTLVIAARMSITNARVQATRATVKVADAILQSRLDAYRRSRFADPVFLESFDVLPQADGARGVQWVPATQIVPSWCDNRDLRRLFISKYLFSRAFPQTWSEVADWMGPESHEQPPTVVNRATEPAEVLLFVLTRSVATFEVDADSINPDHVRDTDGNGKAELLDAWGNPVSFYRWPTRLVRPEGWPASATVTPPINPNDLTRARVLLRDIPDSQPGLAGTGGADDPLNNDPDDMQRFADPLRQTCIAPPAFEDFCHTPRTFHRPLIVSAGPDGLLGLNPSNDRSLSRGYWANPIDNGDLYDNISNGNIR
jgi:hypothetical protein